MHSLGPRNLPRIYTLAMLAGAVTSGIHVRRAQADEYFDPQALEITADQQQASDLSYFSRQGGQQPGRYRVAVVVNQTQRDEREIAFVDTGNALTGLQLAYLKRLGINIAAFSSFDALHDEETFTDIGKYIPDASTHFDFTHHRLVFSIPQAAMLQKCRLYSSRTVGRRHPRCFCRLQSYGLDNQHRQYS